MILILLAIAALVVIGIKFIPGGEKINSKDAKLIKTLTKEQKERITFYEGIKAEKNTLLIVAKPGEKEKAKKELKKLKYEKLGTIFDHGDTTIFIVKFPNKTGHDELIKIKKDLSKKSYFKSVEYNGIMELID